MSRRFRHHSAKKKTLPSSLSSPTSSGRDSSPSASSNTANTTNSTDTFNLDSLVQKALVIVFHFLVLTVPFFFTWFNEELFEFNKMLLTYALTAVIGGLWVMRMIITKQLILKKSWLDIPIMLFIASQILSTLFSMHPTTSWFGYYTRFHGGLLSTLTYTVLFYAFVSNVHKRQVVAFIATLLIAAIGAGAYAIPEHFGVSPSCMFIDGQATTNCWSENTNPRYRIFGTFGQPNWLAAYAITLLPNRTKESRQIH
jgi:putative inorganic carbon (HCO3(-)) transporter